MIEKLNEKIRELEDKLNIDNIESRQLHGDILYLIMSISTYYNELTVINSSHFMTYTYDIKGVSNNLQMTKLLKIFDIPYFTNNKIQEIENNYDSILYFFYEKLLLFYEANGFIPNEDTLKTLFCIFYYCSISYMATDPKLKKVLPKHLMGTFTDSKAVSILIRISVIDNIMFTLHAILNTKTKKLTKEDDMCKKWEKYLTEPVAKEGVLDVKLLEDLKAEFQTIMEDIDTKIGEKQHIKDQTIPDKIYLSFFEKNHKYWFTDKFNKIKVSKNERIEFVNKIGNSDKKGNIPNIKFSDKKGNIPNIKFSDIVNSDTVTGSPLDFPIFLLSISNSFLFSG
jgi:hypothetical protein